MNIKNILAVVAHPDDLEMMGAGLMLKLKKDRVKTHVLILTNGAWTSPEGIIMRSKDDSFLEMTEIIKFMDYDSCDILDEPALDLQFKDHLVCEVLKRIDKFDIDTIITTWDKDSHRDHRIASEIALSASRRVQNFMMGQVNYFMKDFFTPNFFVDITNEWKQKIEALSLFRSQWERNQKDWTEFLDVISQYYGKIIGVKRAEGFTATKIKY
jgi:LmbE family N-acetylglucosaminyl deacetylase